MLAAFERLFIGGYHGRNNGNQLDRRYAQSVARVFEDRSGVCELLRGDDVEAESGRVGDVGIGRNSSCRSRIVLETSGAVEQSGGERRLSDAGVLLQSRGCL